MCSLLNFVLPVVLPSRTFLSVAKFISSMVTLSCGVPSSCSIIASCADLSLSVSVSSSARAAILRLYCGYIALGLLRIAFLRGWSIDFACPANLLTIILFLICESTHSCNVVTNCPACVSIHSCGLIIDCCCTFCVFIVIIDELVD